MAVDARITSSSDKALAFFETDVVSFLVSKQFGNTEIDHVKSLEAVVRPHGKVFGFNVSMDKVLGVEVLYPIQHLLSYQ